MHQAGNRGIRVMIDLVVNHTSDEHPWFQAARADPASPYRDWYVWSETEPSDRRQGMVFPGYQETTWTFDEQAGAWYYHRFYDFQPDLNMANPRVRQEIEKIIGFWLQLGVSGFRLDAAPFIIELTTPGDASPRQDFSWLDDFWSQLSWRRGDATILAEANVEPAQLLEYFGAGHRLPMLFNFILNQRTFLALARGEVAPILQALAEMPALPTGCQWATFLRNHDEVDLGRLVGHEHEEVFAAFGPEPEMQLYGRGIRRRLAPMLGNDQRRIEMAYALQFSLPGTPVIRYGDELGMGEDLSLPERNAIRTPMQWSAGPNGGFSSTTRRKDLRRPGDQRRRVRLRAGQRGRPAARPVVAAVLVPARPADAAGVPGVLDRHVPLRRHGRPRGPRPRARGTIGHDAGPHQPGGDQADRLAGRRRTARTTRRRRSSPTDGTSPWAQT